MEILCFIAAVVASIVAVVAKLKAFFLQTRVLRLESDILHQKRMIEFERTRLLQVNTDLSLTMTATELSKNSILVLETDLQSLKDDNYAFKKSFSNDLILQKKDFANYVELQTQKLEKALALSLRVDVAFDKLTELEARVSNNSDAGNHNNTLNENRFAELWAVIADIKCFITQPQPSKEKVQEVEALLDEASNLLQKKAKRASRKKKEVSLLEKAKCDCEITNDFPS